MWLSLVEHWKEKLKALSRQLEGDKNEYDTARLRGQIFQLRAFLALNNEVPAAPE